MTGYLQNATLTVDALSVCMSINGWEMMIPLAFLAATEKKKLSTSKKNQLELYFWVRVS